MGSINTGRIILGGLLAGVVINIMMVVSNFLILGARMQDVYDTLGLQPPGTGAMLVFVLLGFVVGFATVWLYGAIRPRFGPGPRTALVGGTVVWLIGYLVPVTGQMLAGLLLAAVAGFALGWSLLAVILASLAGGALYAEE